MNNKLKLTVLIFFLVYLVVNLIILPDYGLSWDYHNHYYAGLKHLGIQLPSDSSKIPFSPPDPRETTDDPFGPFTQIIPALSQTVFHDRFNILPAGIAYNLPMVIFGVAGVFILFLFLLEAFGPVEAIIGSISLGLLPQYFAYLHNNMKDIPNSTAFTLAVYLFYRLTKKPNWGSLLLASASFAFAFNVKINSVFIPVICLIYFLSVRKKSDFRILSYFLLAPLFALLLWWPFWQDPVRKLLEIPGFYSRNTFNMPNLLWGKIYQSGVNIPLFYPYSFLLVSTPLPILIAAAAGLVFSFRKIFSKKKEYLLLILWFFIPLMRYLSPKIGAIDGVRHFMEVLPALSALAGIGAAIFRKSLIMRIAAIMTVGYLAALLVVFHPFQASYFNFLTGGIKGAQGRFDIDFWGTPQKEAVLWLNQQAPRGAFVHIVMAQSTASVYLRKDLLINLNKKPYQESDYTVLLNRQSFFPLYSIEAYKNKKISSKRTVFSVSRLGVPLVWVFN